MKRLFVPLLALCLLVSLITLHLTGCRLFGTNPGGPDTLSGPTAVATPAAPSTPTVGTGNRVSFRILLPAAPVMGELHDSTPREPLLSAIVAVATSTPTVTFKLTLVNVGNASQPTTSLVKTVPVIFPSGSSTTPIIIDGITNAAIRPLTEGYAQATFTNVPGLPCIGDIHIDGGNISSYSDFHGVTDLTDGENVVVVGPKGSKTREDVLSEVALRIVSDVGLFAKVTPHMAAKIAAAMSGQDLTQSNIYDVVISVFSNGGTTPAKAITAFNFGAPAVTGVVDEGAKTIALTVPYGTTVTALVPTITHTGSSVSPNTGVAQNFSSPVTYTVTAADATTQAYVVTVTVSPNQAKAITAFNFGAPAVTGVVDEGAKTIALSVPYGTTVTALVPTITHTGSSVSPNTGVAQNFSSPVTYTVTAADATTQDYVVTVTVSTNTAELLITEVGSNIYSNSSVWFEVYNNSSQTIDLSAYQVKTTILSGESTFILPSLSLTTGAYAVIRGKTSNTQFNGPKVAYIINGADYPLWWYGGYGFIEILKAGQTVDFVRWGIDSTSPTTPGAWTGNAAPALLNDLGSSIARSSNNDDTGSSADWVQRSFATFGGKNDVTSDTDTDGDGIPDCSEQPGSTFCGLPLYDWGARDNQKDIFIHVDYMDSTDSGVTPRKEALDKIKAVFASHGFFVHFDVGSLYGTTTADYCLENYEHKVPFTTYVSFSVVTGATTIFEYKNSYMNPAKMQSFHYLLMAYRAASGESGRGEMPGNDFYSCLGDIGLNTSSSNEISRLISTQVGVIMHEFGHNLGLGHGGNENKNDKPNYVSIMNYMYTGSGLPTIGDPREGDRYYWFKYGLDGYAASSTFRQYFPGGYSDLHNNYLSASEVKEFSDGTGGSIDESSINETQGLKRAGSAGVDFNGNSTVNDVGISIDLNNDGTIDTLTDFNDWANINPFFQRSWSGSNSGRSLRPPNDNPVNNDHQPVADENPDFMRNH